MDTDHRQNGTAAAGGRVKAPGTQTAIPSSTLAQDGKVVGTSHERLVITDSKSQEHSFTLASDVTMTCDGQACGFEQITMGMKIRVTTQRDAPRVATHVEVIDRGTEKSGH